MNANSKLSIGTEAITKGDFSDKNVNATAGTLPCVEWLACGCRGAFSFLLLSLPLENNNCTATTKCHCSCKCNSDK